MGGSPDASVDIPLLPQRADSPTLSSSDDDWRSPPSKPHLSRHFHRFRWALAGSSLALSLAVLFILFRPDHLLAYDVQEPRFPLATQCILAQNGEVFPDGTTYQRTSRPTITIFQHFSLHDERLYHLQNESIAQHKRYADYWSYGYMLSMDQYVRGASKTVRQRQMNKIYALLQYVLEQVAMDEYGVDWIMLTDADTLIVNPLVPIHALLPTSSSPLLLGTADFNGFNSGVLLYRCGAELVSFLAQVLAMSDNITREYASIIAANPDLANAIPGSGEVETAPSDQRATCLVLQRNEAYGSRYLPYPQNWLNAYNMTSIQSDIALQIHMVSDTKYNGTWLEYLDIERESWRRMKEMGEEERLGQVARVRLAADEHWQETIGGSPDCTWI